MGTFGSSSPLGLPTDILSRLGIGNKTHVKYKQGNDTDTTGGFGLSAFMAQMNSKGFARQNHFMTQIYMPSLNGIERTVSLLCQSAAIPGYTITSSAQMFAGYQYEVPYGVAFNDITMTFYVDGEMKTKAFFDKWLTKIFPDKGMYNLNYSDKYISAINIIQLNAETKQIYNVQLIDAFPKTVGDMRVTHTAAGDIHTIDVTFTYKRWEKQIESAGVLNEILDNQKQGTLDRMASNIKGLLGDVQNTVDNLGQIVGDQIDSIFNF